MTRLSVFIVIIICLQCGQAIAQRENLLSFFPKADSIAEFPPLDAELRVLCQKKIQKRYVSFIGDKGQKKIFIAAITLKPIENLKRDLSLTVDFNGVIPTLNKITTWGYIFDRNSDGKIDYMALVGAAAAVEDDNFPRNFPVRGEKMSTQQLEIFVNHCKLVFNHWADDNYDGNIDAAVHLDMDPDRDWVKRKLVVRSTKFDGTFDSVWAFRDRIDEDKEGVEHTLSAVSYHPLGRPNGEITKADFKELTDILQLINLAAAGCDIGKGEIPGE